ncbi:MAG: zinc-ribbon domain-containing protein [Rudaea sp.]|uniref:zinc-ribbon domain-containing protein n=1 Tax=Rudaea sp. TaxID=2136325 RepID=UPI0039E2C8ED
MACDIATLMQVLQSGDPDEQMQTLDACSAVLIDPTLWYWLIGFTIVCALVGALIGKYKNAVVRDTLLGVALGPLGWLISLLLPKSAPKPSCRACGKSLEAGDRYCRHCGAALSP